MGTLLDKPNTERINPEEGESNGIRYGFSSMQGWRTEMEDAHTVYPHMEGAEDHSFFAVFDGHGGTFAAQYAAKQIVRHIHMATSWEAYITGGMTDPELLKNALEEAYLDLDKNLKDEIRNNPTERSGCTAVSVIVSPTHMIVANCGDSRCVLSTAGNSESLSDDHKPWHENEKSRIIAAGGVVSMKRVDGELAVSRALGDFQYKDDGLDPKMTKVTAFPDVLIKPRSEGDEAMILACDGIWDVMSTDMCLKTLASYWQIGEKSERLMCEEIMDDCLNRNSRDNMSVCVVMFPAGVGQV